MVRIECWATIYAEEAEDRIDHVTRINFCSKLLVSGVLGRVRFLSRDVCIAWMGHSEDRFSEHVISWIIRVEGWWGSCWRRIGLTAFHLCWMEMMGSAVKCCSMLFGSVWVSGLCIWISVVETKS